MLEKNMWLLYVALAGLAWGTYVPVIFYGGSELGGKPLSRMAAILCVGGAYFVLGVLVPLYFLWRDDLTSLIQKISEILRRRDY